MKLSRRALGQFGRFATVGLVSNAILYVGYLVLTSFGVGPKVAMTVLFITGVLQTFFFNKKWSFGHSGAQASTFARYAMAYASAYVLNLALLLVLVDAWKWPHEVVQATAILTLAAYLFVVQKLWVFSERS
jgi:Predicted membrane protein